MERADVVVVGAGIMGASIAFQLVSKGAGRVVLVDGRGLSSGDSGRTFGQVRRHYSNELTTRLANRGFEVIRNWDDEVGVGDPEYVPLGYLLTVTEGALEACRRNVALGQRLGVETAFVEPEDIPAIEPLVNLEGVAGGAFEPDAGYVDVRKMVLSWFAAATMRGLVSMLDATVTGIAVRGGRVTEVQTTRGSVATGVMVDAAGTWGRDLVAPLGVQVPMSFIRVTIGVLRQPAGRPGLRVCLTDTPGNLVARPDRGPLAWFVAYEPSEVPGEREDHDPPVDPGYEAFVRSVLARRLPSYVGSDWVWGAAGLYDVMPDWHPIVGWAPGVEGLYLALGFSGHGLKLSPAIGEIVADEVLGRMPLIDVSALRLERFERGELMDLAYGPGARA